MAMFTVRFRLTPSAPFGLPDGTKIVVPVDPTGARPIYSNTYDTRTGRIGSYGTLPVYRNGDQALRFDDASASPQVSVHDNFLAVQLEASDGDEASNQATSFTDRVCQILSVQHGSRMSAEFYGVEDAAGEPVKVKRWEVEELFTLTTYDIVQLRERMLAAIKIARNDDPVLRKALLYFDHAPLVFGEASKMPFKAPHEAFYRGLAFLQLYKGLSLILGEPGTDKDYQSRFKKLGLPAGFLSNRVTPLYDVRNDEDVAHYSREFPDSDAFVGRFQEAVSVFRETLVAYARTLDARSA